MAMERSAIGWGFWGRWVLVTAVGYAVGFLLGFVIGHVLWGNIIFGVSVGAGVGFMQWRILRPFVPRSGWWVPASMAGLTLSFGLYAVVRNLWPGIPFDLGWPGGVLGWGLTLVLGGILLGMPQQSILRRHGGGAAWWVPASAAGWGLSVFGLAIPPDMSGGYAGALAVLLFLRNGLLAPAVAGIILGATTGAGLVWLLRRQTPDNVP